MMTARQLNIGRTDRQTVIKFQCHGKHSIHAGGCFQKCYDLSQDKEGMYEVKVQRAGSPEGIRLRVK